LGKGHHNKWLFMVRVSANSITMTALKHVIVSEVRVRYHPWQKFACGSYSLQNDLVCTLGEFLGSGIFLGGPNFAGIPIISDTPIMVAVTVTCHGDFKGFMSRFRR
jgi:hypothetical protein